MKELHVNLDRAILFTDVVDSTLLASKVGDAEMATLWTAHDRQARELLRQWRGREIDKSDGFLLLFDAVEDALGYAVEYHGMLAQLATPMKARAGIHAGPVALRHNESDDVARGAKPVEVDGLTKALAARVMSVAQGGQTLLTASSAAGLAESGVRLIRHGYWRFKGFDDAVELVEVADGHELLVPPNESDKGYRVVRSHDIWLPLREIRHTVPAERDSFIGRRAPLGVLARRLDDGARLVTVAGLGGAGKTRLAQRFGWTRLADFSGSVWFCDLSMARSLDGIAHAVAKGLDVSLGRGDPIDQLGNALAGRAHCLVILDNFEQVTSLAEETVGRWLAKAKDLRVIVTSREVLNIAGEQVLLLEALDHAEAVEMFCRRAEAACPGFRTTRMDHEAIDLLVKLLDGLPLAIELAAARVRVMPPRVLLDRMSARFEVLVSSGERRDRQATLRLAFDWSWGLLTLHEQAALAQLSVFEGGFTLPAAEAVVDLGSRDAPPVVDVLQSLVEKSLVRHRSDTRFDQLVSAQEYAAMKLRSSNPGDPGGMTAMAEAQRRHCAFFANLGEAGAVADACADLDNMVAACRRAVTLDEPDSAVGALEGAAAALMLQGPFQVAVDLAAQVRGISDLALGRRARADRVAGKALRHSGRIAEARATLEAAVKESIEAGDRATQRRALSHLGDLCLNSGRVDESRAHLSTALALARRDGDRVTECEVLCGLGNLFEHIGSMAEARGHYEAALKLARDTANRRWEAGSLGNLGLLHANQGHMAEARQYYEAGLVAARELGHRQWEGNTLCNLGLLHHVEGRFAQAREALEAALALARHMGNVRLGGIVSCNLGMVFEAMQQPDEALNHYEHSLMVARDVHDTRSEGQVLSYLGLLHAKQGRFNAARAGLDKGERLLVEMSDKLNLSLLMCSRAEVEWLAGERLAAEQALDAARALAEGVSAQPASELGLALARLGATLRGAAAD